MRKLILLLTTTLLSLSAHAVDSDAVFTGTVASSCTVVTTENGTLTLNGTSVTASGFATVEVTANEPNVYKVRVASPNGFTSVPVGYDGVATLVNEYSVAGENDSSGFKGEGVETNLVNSGLNQMTISVFGSTDKAMTAGDYTATAVATCIAQ